MKFTKTAVALAVASLIAVPMSASATTTLSGLVQIKIGAVDEDDLSTAADESDPIIAAGDVLFGIATEHTMNNGLTGYGSLRADIDSLSNSGQADADSVYVGVKGGFGDLRFGEIPLAVEYGQLSNDIYDVGAEINGGISYTGSFGPASIIANVSPGENSDAFGLGAKFSAGGFTVGIGFEERDELANASVGVSFAYAGATIGIHGATLESAATEASPAVAEVPNSPGVLGSAAIPAVLAAPAGPDTDIFGVKVGYGFGPVSLGLTYMTQDIGDASEDTTRLDIVYDMGGDTELSSRINSFGGDAEGSDWRIQLTKFF